MLMTDGRSSQTDGGLSGCASSTPLLLRLLLALELVLLLPVVALPVSVSEDTTPAVESSLEAWVLLLVR
jgi:hypothetical protein